MINQGAADVDIRVLRSDDDLDAQYDLSERAFGVPAGGDRTFWYQLMALAVEGGSYFGAFAGGRAAGGALFYDMRQWWCGRPVPMAGVSSVKVAPEDRGRGIGRQLMVRVLDEIAGWELAGSRYTAVIPGRSLQALMPADPAAGDPPVAAATRLRRAGPADAQAVIDVLGRAHGTARTSGPLTWDAATVAVHLARSGSYSYLCDEGFTSYRWHNGNDGLFVAGVHDADIQHRSMWMLRVVDAPAAIAARGFPLAVAADISLIINDQSRPANSGHWTLSVSGGKGELVRAPQGRGVRGEGSSRSKGAATALTLGARGLAALYGGAPVASLRLAGLAAGGTPEADAGLDAVFAADPYQLDAF